VATAYGRIDGHPVRRDFGWVFGDAHVARVSGMTTRPELRELFAGALRQLVLADEQHLGIRRRRFRHQAPTGWDVRSRGFTTIYGLPGARIEVSAAIPCQAWRDDVERQIEATGSCDGLTVEQRTAGARVKGAQELEGRSWELACRQGSTRFVRRLATFVDDRYLYALRLDTLDGAGREVFDGVVRSVEPIPRARHRRPTATVAAFDHWC
jgi:hypothetical protein